MPTLSFRLARNINCLKRAEQALNEMRVDDGYAKEFVTIVGILTLLEEIEHTFVAAQEQRRRG
jgi:hypothetical protein